jgi:hypothetical protein
MRFSVLLASMFVAGTAQAHVGHFGDLAGHDHWVAAGAIGAAIALAGWNILKGKKDKEAEVDAEAEDEMQEA